MPPDVQAPPTRQCHPTHPPSSPTSIRFVTPFQPQPHLHLTNSVTMRAIPPLLALLAIAAADDLVTKGRIKVQLFAAPAFVSEVSVDAYHDQCLSLDNNLYDAGVRLGCGQGLMWS